MKTIVKVSNLNFKYREKIVFNNLNMNIKKGIITSIIGCNGSGKSTLVKILLGLLKFDGEIHIDNQILVKNSVRDIRKDIGVVFCNPDNQFVAETVMDDIAFTLENMNCEKKLIKKKVLSIAEYIGISDILEKNPHELSGGQKQLVAFASALVHDPKLLILDEALTMIDSEVKKVIYSLLLDLKKKGLSIVIITHDMEETTISDEIVVLNNGVLLYQDKKEVIYKMEKELNELGFILPFMVEISNRLIFYNLIDEIFYDMELLVNKLWK